MQPATIKISLLLLSLWALTGCSVDGFEGDSSGLTPEESLIAGQIIGESLSENRGGLLSSFPEAFAIPTSTGLINGPSPLSGESFRNLQNYNYEFETQSGQHRVTFSKQSENELFRTVSEYTLIYIFYNADQQPIASPESQQGRIEAVDFRAIRNGEIDGSIKKSIFTRTDRLFIEGISTSTDILSIDGFHAGNGLFTQISNDGSEIQREYFLDLNYLDLRINKELVQRNRNFRTGVNGAFSYESTIRQAGNGNNGSGTKIVNGTVELNGDGTALLKFREQFDSFRLRLANGEVFEDDEFEGRVTRVNLEDRIFTISNGQRIQINDQTEIEQEDFNTLEEVAQAVNNGVRVIAEGDYFHPDETVNLWIATELEFELESNEFQDLVASVNLEQHSIILANGDELFITEETDIEFNDDLTSLRDVADAVNEGMPVEAEGDFYIGIETGKRILKEVEFEFDFEEFEENVTSVNLSESTFTLENGRIVRLTDDTIISEESDFLTLEEVAEALDNEIRVEANGKYFNSNGSWIAVIVEFEN
ncbi:MAG: DUF5666 domain-containing protein [Balneolales bacterium]